MFLAIPQLEFFLERGRGRSGVTSNRRRDILGLLAEMKELYIILRRPRFLHKTMGLDVIAERKA